MNTRRIVLFVLQVVCCAVLAPLSAQNWLETLRGQAIVDSIVPHLDANPTPESQQYRSYMIYYHQPLEHANPQSEQFQLRALLTVNVSQDVTTAVNHLYIGGYAIEPESLVNPNADFADSQGSSCDEIAQRYNANFIQPEYRYFAQSAPADRWNKMGLLRSEEAADDFHALITALKTVFHGKWAISGTSKGGIATVAQFTFHPEDADVFVPYVAPIFDSYCDTTMQQYWMQNGWTQEWRELYLSYQQYMLYNRETIFPVYYKLTVGAGEVTQAKRDSAYHGYLMSVASFGFDDRSTGLSLDKLQTTLNENATVLGQLGLLDYSDTVCAYMAMNENLSLAEFPRWLDTLRNNPGYTPREQEDPIKPYYYQAKAELGYYDYRFNLLVHPGDEALATQLNQQYLVLGPIIEFGMPFNLAQPYSATLYNQMTTAVQNASKPILFIYGEDDPWTGKMIPAPCINGSNSRLFILPQQNHTARFTKPTDPEQSGAITDVLDAVLGTTQGVEVVESRKSKVESRKVLINGQFIIIRNNEKYTITGKKL